MEKNFYDILKKNPLIAAVKNPSMLDKAIESRCNVIFLLCGSISTLKETVKKIKAKGKMVFVHIDLIDGIGKDSAAIAYLKNEFKPDGIITTKNQLIRAAKENGLLTIQRFFLLDSISLSRCRKISKESTPSAVEIMPGIMPRIIKRVSEEISAPVIVGGLVHNKEDIENAIVAGSLGVSTTSCELWER